MLPQYVFRDRSELEAQSQDRCQTAYLGPGRLICRVLGKYLMYVDPDDIGITPRLCLDGYWESWITLAIARRLQPGLRCVDVGANHGYYTMLMADAVGEQGRVAALEPNAELAEILRTSLELNGFQQRAFVVERAASDVSRKAVELSIPTRRAMDASITLRTATADRVQAAKTITIDDLTSDWSSVDLIKIDAEGAEEEIWKGMSETIRRNPKIVVVLEMAPSRYSDPRRFVRRIVDDGFVLRHVSDDGRPVELATDEVINGNEWMLFLEKS